MTTHTNWIERIVPTIGLLLGIVFVAVGAVIAGGNALKLALYEPQPASTFNYQCEFKNGFDTTQPESRLTTEERAACITTAQADDAIVFRTNKKNAIIDGAMFLVVGSIFWLTFKRWHTKA